MTKKYDWWIWSEPQLDSQQIKDINKLIDDNYIDFEPSDLGARDTSTGRPLKNIKPKNIAMKHLLDTPIFDMMSLAEKTINETFCHHLFPINRWDQLLHNRYSSDIKGHYGKHTDGSRSDIYDVKITFLINLSEGDYEGGDLLIKDKNPNFRVPGSMLIFKSEFVHEVTPVTRGERISLTHLFCGPRYK